MRHSKLPLIETNPALWAKVRSPIPCPSVQPARGPLSDDAAAAGWRLCGDRGQSWHIRAPVERGWSSFKREPQKMSHNLILAQNNAFNLAQMLMAPVTLFQNDGQFGVMLSAEYDGEEETVIHVYDPFDEPLEIGSAH